MPVRKDGRVQHTDARGEKKASLSDQAVYKMVKRRHREAEIKDVSPHDFRKTFVGDLLDAIGDLSTVQKLAGHSDPATTAFAEESPHLACADNFARNGVLRSSPKPDS